MLYVGLREPVLESGIAMAASAAAAPAPAAMPTAFVPTWTTAQIDRPLPQALRTTPQLSQALAAATATIAAGDAGALNNQTGMHATTTRVAEIVTTIAQSEGAMQQLNASGIYRRPPHDTAIPMPIGLYGNLQPGLAARVVAEPPQSGDAARASVSAVARAAATDGAGDAARAAGGAARAADNDDAMLAGGLGADGDTQTAVGGLARRPYRAACRTAMSADERKRRNTAAAQARRKRQRQLVATAETARADDRQLTLDQQRALEACEREQARGRARDWSRANANRPKRPRTAANDGEEGEDLAAAAAAIVSLAPACQGRWGVFMQ